MTALSLPEFLLHNHLITEDKVTDLPKIEQKKKEISLEDLECKY